MIEIIEDMGNGEEIVIVDENYKEKDEGVKVIDFKGISEKKVEEEVI